MPNRVRQKRVFRREETPQLFSPTVDERLPSDHMVRRLKQYAEQAAGKGLRGLYEEKGGIAYDPVGLLLVHLYGFMLGIRSTRQLEDLCRYDVRFMYLTGSLVPDHNTLARFRHRLGPHLPELFACVLEHARKDGLVGLKVVAVDGTKIEGNVSQWKKLVSEANQAEPLSDANARLMRDRRKGRIRGYNAQIGVDQEMGLIVGYGVSNAAKDSEEMAGMLDSVEQSVGDVPEAVVADAGYDSAANHAALESREVKGFIAPQQDYDAFWVLDEAGQLRCPAGRIPVYQGQSRHSNGLYDRYVIRGCGGCPLRRACGVSKTKAISTRSGYTPHARVRNAARSNTEEGRLVLGMRSRMVELPFAHLKCHRKLRRFLTRGLSGVRTEFGMACLAYNLERLLGAFLVLLYPLVAFRAMLLGPAEAHPGSQRRLENQFHPRSRNSGNVAHAA